MRTTVVVCLLLLLVAAAHADPPQTLSYQGVLRDGSGDVVADGSYDITFRLYTLATGGTALWTETQSVAVADGIFDVVLGSVTPFTAVTFNFPYWLGVTVAGDLEMTPRTELTSAPYAIRALYTDIPSDDDWAFAGENIYRDTGKVGIGTSDPAEELHVAGDAEVDGVLRTNTITSVEAPAPKEPEAPPEAELRKPAKGGKHKHEEATPINPTTRQQSLQLQTDGTTRVHIDGVSGDVGIGTETPGARLDVEGTLEATGIRMPTGAGDDLVMTSDSSGNASWQLWSEGRVGNIEYADQYQDQFEPGDAGGPIEAAIRTLARARTDGIVDARGIPGGSIDLNMLQELDRSIDRLAVTILLGAGTYDVSIPQVVDADTTSVDLRILGQGASTTLRPTHGMTMFTALGHSFHMSDIQFDLDSTNSTAVAIRGMWPGGPILERLWIHNSAGTAPLLSIGDDWASTGAAGAVIRDCFLHGPLTIDAIEVGAEGVHVDHITVWGCHAGVSFRGGTSSSVTNSLFWHGIHAMVVEDGASYQSLLFAGNDCESPWSEGAIRIVGSAVHYPIMAVTIRDNYFTGLRDPDDDAIYLKNVKGAVIEGNRFGTSFAAGAESVRFDEGVSEVCLSGNITSGIEPTMEGYGVAGLPLNDVRAAQCSGDMASGGAMVVGGLLTARQAVHLEPLSLAPSGPSEGDMYMNAITHKLMVFDGTTWRACW